MVTSLPLYAIRDYYSIGMEGVFRVIQTEYSKYVLDYPELEGNYWDRRLKMLDMILPYKLYSIKKRFEFVSQLLTHKNRWFIDDNGTIIKYKPSRLCKLKTNPIIASWVARNGDTMFKVQGCSHTFRAKLKTDPSFLTYAQDGIKFYMYGLSDTKLETRRKKI